MSREQIVDPYFEDPQHPQGLAAQVKTARKKCATLTKQTEKALVTLSKLLDQCKHPAHATTTDEYTDDLGRVETVTTKRCSVCEQVIWQKSVPNYKHGDET